MSPARSAPSPTPSVALIRELVPTVRRLEFRDLACEALTPSLLRLAYQRIGATPARSRLSPAPKGRDVTGLLPADRAGPMSAFHQLSLQSCLPALGPPPPLSEQLHPIRPA